MSSDRKRPRKGGVVDRHLNILPPLTGGIEVGGVRIFPHDEVPVDDFWAVDENGNIRSKSSIAGRPKLVESRAGRYAYFARRADSEDECRAFCVSRGVFPVKIHLKRYARGKERHLSASIVDSRPEWIIKAVSPKYKD